MDVKHAMLRSLVGCATPHRRLFWMGVASTLPLVGCQLALPLVLSAWTEGLGGTTGGFSGSAPYAIFFVASLVAIGAFDYVQRLQFARFAIGWSRSLRADALRCVGSPRLSAKLSKGEITSILIADVARFKAGVKVFLTYVATNALLLAGASAVLFAEDVRLGSIFGTAVLLTVAIAAIGSRGTYHGYLTYRRHEGELARVIEEGLNEDADEVATFSSESEASEARINARATLWAHVVMGCMVMTALVVGARGVSSGEIQATSLVVFVGYAFLLTKPMVRLARHGARTGKLVACADRLCGLPAGHEGLREAVFGEIHVPEIPGNAADLSIPPGGRLLVVGPHGSGKSQLLRAIAGRTGDSAWKVTIGGVAVADVGADGLDRLLGFLEKEVTWSRQSLRSLLSPSCCEGNVIETVRAFGLDTIDVLPDGLGTRLSSRKLSREEARALRLAELLCSERRIILVDDPPAATRSVLLERMVRDRDRTWVVASNDAVGAERFDLVLELSSHGVDYLGPPRMQREREGPSGTRVS